MSLEPEILAYWGASDAFSNLSDRPVWGASDAFYKGKATRAAFFAILQIRRDHISSLDSKPFIEKFGLSGAPQTRSFRMLKLQNLGFDPFWELETVDDRALKVRPWPRCVILIYVGSLQYFTHNKVLKYCGLKETQ